VGDAARLVDVATSGCHHLAAAYKERKLACQNVDGFILEVVNVQRCGVAGRAQCLDEAEQASVLLSRFLGAARQV
jgi:hypothetical protein